MTRSGWLMIAAGITLAAPSVWAEQAVAKIQGTKPGSAISGTASFTPTDAGMSVVIEISGAPPGSHGIHLHEHGSCEEGGAAAGGHYNPAGVQHGFVLKDGAGAAHAGDFGNIEIAEDGNGNAENSSIQTVP